MLVAPRGARGRQGRRALRRGRPLAFEKLLGSRAARSATSTRRCRSTPSTSPALRGARRRCTRSAATWTQAVELLLRAEAASGSRLERVELLWRRRRSSPSQSSRIRRARSSSTSACSSSIPITSRPARGSPIGWSRRSAGTTRCRCSRCSRARPRVRTGSSAAAARPSSARRTRRCTAPRRRRGTTGSRSSRIRTTSTPRSVWPTC